MKLDIIGRRSFTVYDWMVSELELKSIERDVYAIIYSHSQDGESDFHGNLSYISQLTGYSRNSVCTALKSLVNKNYILKEEKMVNNIKFCRYRTNTMDAGTNTMDAAEDRRTNTMDGHYYIYNKTTIIHNKTNNKNNKNNNKKSIVKKPESNITEKIVYLYHTICTNLPKVRAITDKRRKAIHTLLKTQSIDIIKQVFEKANKSSFLTGNNDRGWKADLDFILREDKFISILEGKYDDRPNTSNLKRFGETSKMKYTRYEKNAEDDKYESIKF